MTAGPDDELDFGEGPRRYEIRDASGALVAIHERVPDAIGGKSFRWIRADGKTLGLNGTPVVEMPLYGIHLLDGRHTVVLVEGEKAADALMALGIAAVATVTGAAVTPTERPLSELAGKIVFLWPDADDVGRRHMDTIARKLQPIAASVYVVDWPDAPEHGDAADATPNQVRDLLERPLPWVDPTAPTTATLYTVRELAELPSADEEYLVADGILTRGGKLLIYGKSGGGKTTLMHFLAGAIATGRPFLGRFAIDRPRSILVIQGELSLPEMSSHAQQLLSAGLDSDNLHFARMTGLRLPDDELVLRNLIAAAKAEIVMLDPWYRLFTGESSNQGEQVDKVFTVCDRLLEEGLAEAVVVVHHANVTGARTAGSYLFEGWPSTIIKIEPLEGMKSHRILAFEKVRAPSSTLLNERIRVALGDAGYLQVAVPEVPTPAGATLAAVIVEEAAGQLARQDLLARLMERAQCKERAANKYLGQAIQAGRLAKVRDGAQVLYQSMPEVMA